MHGRTTAQTPHLAAGLRAPRVGVGDTDNERLLADRPTHSVISAQLGSASVTSTVTDLFDQPFVGLA
jgi:hypothetical protein